MNISNTTQNQHQRHYNIAIFFGALLLLFSMCKRESPAVIMFEGFDKFEEKAWEIRNVNDKSILSTPSLVGETTINITKPQYAEAVFNNSTQALLLLEPGKKTSLSWNSADSSVFVADSASQLLNFLWKSNNEFVSENLSLLYSDGSNAQTLNLFKDLIAKRETRIKSSTSSLSDYALKFLLNQNFNRAYSYLLYYGKAVKRLSHEDSFYNFITSIDYNEPLNQYMAKNILLKLEIEYHREKGHPEDLIDFFSYISQKIKDDHLLSYYRALYLKELSQEIPYWAEHLNLLDEKVMHQLLEKYEELHPNNEYRAIFDQPTAEYIQDRSGG